MAQQPEAESPRRVSRWGSLAIAALCLVGLTKLLYLPVSERVTDAAQQRLVAPRGSELVLEGLGEGPVAAYTAPLDGGFEVRATRARLGRDGVQGTAAWTVMRDPALEHAQVTVNLSLEGTSRTGLVIARGRQGELASLVLKPLSGTLAVSIEATLGSESLQALQQPPRLLSPSGEALAADLLEPVTLRVADGGALTLKLPRFTDADATFVLGGLESNEEQLLPRRIVVRPQGSNAATAFACAAPPGAKLIASTLRASLLPRVEGKDCAAPGPLQATNLTVAANSVSVDPFGSGYFGTGQPRMASWASDLSQNAVLAPIFLALVAWPALTIWRLLSGQRS